MKRWKRSILLTVLVLCFSIIADIQVNASEDKTITLKEHMTSAGQYYLLIEDVLLTTTEAKELLSHEDAAQRLLSEMVVSFGDAVEVDGGDRNLLSLDISKLTANENRQGTWVTISGQLGGKTLSVEGCVFVVSEELVQGVQYEVEKGMDAGLSEKSERAETKRTEVERSETKGKSGETSFLSENLYMITFPFGIILLIWGILLLIPDVKLLLFYKRKMRENSEAYYAKSKDERL